MRIAIIGCGSLGLLWGARLSALGWDPTLFSRTAEQAVVLENKGVLLHTLQGEKVQYPVKVGSPSDKGIFDIVLVAVKQTQLSSILSTIQEMTHPESHILFFQNGLGHEEQVRNLDHRLWTYAVVTTEGAYRKGAYQVCHTGIGTMWIGYLTKRKNQLHPQMEDFMRKLCVERDLDLHFVENILHKMWEKLLINCVINPLTALEGVQNGMLLSSVFDVRIHQIAKEAVDVARKKGFLFCEQEIIKKVREVCRKTKYNFSSMAQDVRRRKCTEIHHMNGMIVQWGNQFGVNTPYNQSVVDRIEQLLE